MREALQRALQRFEGRPGDAASWRELHALIQQQHWRVAHFRVAADDINYRRFFNINDLAGLRMELPEVFDHTHRACCGWSRTACSTGCASIISTACAIPRRTCGALQRRLSARRSGRHFYLVVEKILSPTRRLRADWPMDGTTGYDFLNQVLALLIDAGAESAFTDCYAEFTGEQRSFGEIARLSKLHIMENEMASELNVLARDMARLARQNPRTADFTRNLLRRAIKELIACFPVYRTYLDSNGELDEADQRDLSWALAQATAQRDRDRSERIRLSRAGAQRATWCASRAAASRASRCCAARCGCSSTAGRWSPRASKTRRSTAITVSSR